MKPLKIYAILTFLFLGSTTLSAQSMLELYFGGDRDRLINEAYKLIHLPEPTFKPITQPTELNPEAVADMGFEQVYKSETRYFMVRDSMRIFTFRTTNWV